MATYCDSVSHTFSEYLLVPGFSDETCIPSAVNLKTPLVKFKKGEEPSMKLLDAYSPLKVLGRGYSIVEKDGQTVTDALALQRKDRISIRMNQGKVTAEVLSTEGGLNNGGKEKDI